ncbi:MAG: hypothetical protein HC936_14345, partial [Leptolyngbyaceae cyanobacterium SU_3_3]|nr:hypothetical protein [Leptolyngbyaceae cyanobacterium SU_3_3]
CRVAIAEFDLDSSDVPDRRRFNLAQFQFWLRRPECSDGDRTLGDF